MAALVRPFVGLSKVGVIYKNRTRIALIAPRVQWTARQANGGFSVTSFWSASQSSQQQMPLEKRAGPPRKKRKRKRRSKMWLMKGLEYLRNWECQ